MGTTLRIVESSQETRAADFDRRCTFVLHPGVSPLSAAGIKVAHMEMPASLALKFQ